MIKNPLCVATIQPLYQPGALVKKLARLELPIAKAAAGGTEPVRRAMQEDAQ